MQYGQLTFCVRPPVTIDVAIPENEKELQNGLNDYKSLRLREGMIFPSREWPETDEVAMWQDRVSMELCIGFIDKDWRVSDMYFTHPGDKKTYGRGRNVLMAFEVRPDLIEKFKIKIGTRVVPGREHC